MHLPTWLVPDEVGGMGESSNCRGQEKEREGELRIRRRGLGEERPRLSSPGPV